MGGSGASTAWALVTYGAMVLRFRVDHLDESAVVFGLSADER
jgi:hypothetical protein